MAASSNTDSELSPSRAAISSKQALGAPALHKTLSDYVKRRVPPSEVDDVVQTILCDALASDRRPDDNEELRKWVIGIARHKIADFHRRSGREQPTELSEIEVAAPDVETRSMVEWAERQAQSTRDAHKTLDWMAREGEGEKLETIAGEEDLPPARVRQRVSRMRRWMKERWLAELAAVAALTALVVGAIWLFRRDPVEVSRDEPTASPTNRLTPAERAVELRGIAFKACEREQWERCLDRLDEAGRLDAEGDAAPDVQRARERAAAALEALDQEQSDEPDVQDSKDHKSAPPPPVSPTASPPKPAPPPVQQKQVSPPKQPPSPDKGKSKSKTVPEPEPSEPTNTNTAPPPTSKPAPNVAPKKSSAAPQDFDIRSSSIPQSQAPPQQQQTKGSLK